MKFSRKKNPVLILSLLYRMYKYYPFSNKRKIKRLLTREWIYKRLAFEESFKMYNPAEHPFYLNAREFIQPFISSGMEILDIGCKHGHILNFIAKNDVIITGIDHDENAINIAKKKYSIPNLHFIHRDAIDHFNQSEKKYDLIILSNFLEHLDDPEEFLSKLHPFSKLIYIDLPDFDASYLNVFRKNFNASLIYEDNDHIFEFTREELIKILHETGYEIITSSYKFGFQKYIIKSIEK
ncbi:MAG: class I SAM-dependent methyltransferase [Bacteroidota bacterium]